MCNNLLLLLRSSILPKDKYGETDFQKLNLIASISSIVTLCFSVCTFGFYLVRVIWCYSNMPSNNDTYYGLIATLTCLLGLQGMHIAFAALNVLGTLKKELGFLFLWLVSLAVILPLELLVIVYASLLTNENVAWNSRVAVQVDIVVFVTRILFTLAPGIICITFYRALKDYIKGHREQTEILL